MGKRIDPAQWNPRYVAYCAAHGVDDPDVMRARDAERWPGGKMCGFILWMRERKAEFVKAHPEGVMRGGGIIDHDAYTAFIETRAREIASAGEAS